MVDSENSDISSIFESDLHGNIKNRNDITELEKDTELLARKAKKRLVGGFNGRSENMIEKLIGWARRKKTVKIQTMLNSLFPKLKHSEEEIKSWASSVREKKEAAAIFGNVLLFDLDHQISLFQSHMEFLDEVINDVRQLDYDVVREISELKVALHFNQELLKKSRDAGMHHPDQSENVSDGQSPPDPGKETSQVQRVGEVLSPTHEGAIDPPIEANQRMIIGGLSSNCKSDNIKSDAPLSSNCKSDNIRSDAPLSPQSGETNHFDSSLNSVVWDGAESKRRSLASRSISLNTLPLSDTSKNSISPKEKFASRKISKGIISSLFRKSFSLSSTGVPAADSDSETGLLYAMSRIGSKTTRNPENRVDTPIRQRADSTSSAHSSSSETAARTSSDAELTVSSSVPPTLPPLSNPKKRYKNGRDAKTGLKISSFLQFLPDDMSNTGEEKCDSDEEELIRRINKCLALKNILRAILKMIQDTQDNEVAGLRKMKVLSKELGALLKRDASSDIDQVQSANTIQSQVLSLNLSSRPNSVGSKLFLADSSSASEGTASPHFSTLGSRIAISSGEAQVARDDTVNGFESDEDSQLWYNEASNASDGTVSPHVAKFSRYYFEDKVKRTPPLKNADAHDSVSIGSSSTPLDNSAFQEAASEFIDDLKALVQEEQQAKERLAKLQEMILSATQIDSKLKGGL
jgi:hypothetical protein